MSWFRRRRPLREAAIQEEIRTEAQIDLRDGLLEARADRIAELLEALEQARIREARLVAELSTYKTKDYLRLGARLRYRLANEPTDPYPSAVLRREPN